MELKTPNFEHAAVNVIHYAIELLAVLPPSSKVPKAQFAKQKELLEQINEARQHYLDTRVFFAVGGGRWGKGVTLEQAIATYRAVGGKLSDDPIFYSSPLGSSWTGSYPALARELGAEPPYEVDKNGERKSLFKCSTPKPVRRAKARK